MGWDDTHLLGGTVVHYVTIVGKQRGAEAWFSGAFTDQQPHILQAKLDFLTPGKHCSTQIYRDGPDADLARNPEAIVIDEHQVGSADTLSLGLTIGGGPAIRFKALQAALRWRRR